MSNQFPAGSYDAVCTGEVQYGYSSGGNDQVGINLEIHGPEGFESFHCTAILYFSPDAKQMSIDKLKACGWNGSGDIAPQIQGKPCRVGVSYKEHEGKLQMKVNIYDRAPGIKFNNVMDERKKSQFLASLASSAGGGGTRVKDNGYPAVWDEQDVGPPPDAPPAQARGRLSLGGK